MRVIIMRGIPGAGKSTAVEKLRGPGVVVMSADDHFYDWRGEYRFDPAKLGEAHGECLRRFNYILVYPFKAHTIIVDNTNIGVEEIAPYYALAEAYGADVEIREVHCTPEIAHGRCRHGVPLHAIEGMYARMYNGNLPKRWRVT